jgi:hypothetical protein
MLLVISASAGDDIVVAAGDDAVGVRPASSSAVGPCPENLERTGYLVQIHLILGLLPSVVSLPYGLRYHQRIRAMGLENRVGAARLVAT